MATGNQIYHSLRPGNLGLKGYDLHHGSGEGVGAYMAAFLTGMLMQKNTFPAIGGMLPYVAAQWTVTGTGTGAAQAQATTPGGGLLMTAGSTSTFYSGLQSKATITPTAGKIISAFFRVQVSHATQIGFNLGFANAQADPSGTEYTDFIGFRKAPTSATVKATVIGNASGVPVQSASLFTPVAATEYLLGFYLNLNATAANIDSSFFSGTVGGTITETKLGSISLAAAEALAILTTPPTDWGLTIFGTGTTGNNPTMTVTSALAMVDV